MRNKNKQRGKTIVTGKKRRPQAFLPKEDSDTQKMQPAQSPPSGTVKSRRKKYQSAKEASVIIADEKHGLVAYDRYGWPSWDAKIPATTSNCEKLLPKEFNGDHITHARWGIVYGINSRDGTLEWSAGRAGKIIKTLGQTNDYAIVTQLDKGTPRTYALTLSDGEVAWTATGDRDLADYNEKYCALAASSGKTISIVSTESGRELLNIQRNQEIKNETDTGECPLALYDDILAYVERKEDPYLQTPHDRITIVDLKSGNRWAVNEGDTHGTGRRMIECLVIRKNETDPEQIDIVYVENETDARTLKRRKLNLECNAKTAADSGTGWEQEIGGYAAAMNLDEQNRAVILERILQEPAGDYGVNLRSHLNAYNIDDGKRAWEWGPKLETSTIGVAHVESNYLRHKQTLMRTTDGLTVFKNKKNELYTMNARGRITNRVKLFEMGYRPIQGTAVEQDSIEAISIRTDVKLGNGYCGGNTHEG